MKKCKILIPIGSRSDKGLSKPIIERLKKDEMFEVHITDLFGGKFFGSYGYSEQEIWDIRPDLVLCIGDRIEMFAMGCAAFVNNTPIAHIYAGVVVSEHPTKDEVFRHSISLMSDVQFVESKKCMLNLEMLFMAIKKESDCYIVGITHLEDLEIDESLVPKTISGEKAWYNLILYNPLTNPEKVQEMEWEIARIKVVAKMGLSRNVIIGSNPDFWYTDKRIKLDKALTFLDKTIFYKNLPRSQFLGLLKNCQKFITNSSTAIYEAPYFLEEDQIINIGIRNSNRDPVDTTKMGTSDKIIKIIKEWWIKKNE